MLNGYCRNPFMIVFVLIRFALASCVTLFSGPTLVPQEPVRLSDSPCYQLVKLKRKNLTLPPIVHGQLVSKIDSLPLKLAAVKVRRLILRTDNTGVYHWQGKPGTYTFLARSIGYADVVSKNINLVKGDSIILNFQLSTDVPLLHKMSMHKK